MQQTQFIPTLETLPIDNKTVLLRVDYNVPLKKDGSIADLTRIKASLDTIKYLLEKNAKIIILSHLGRPKKNDLSLSLKNCAIALENLLHLPVFFNNDPLDEKLKKKIQDFPPRSIILLENVRFFDEEERPEKNPLFARKLADLGDFYINDAFGCAHRAHSTISSIPLLMPGRSAMGKLMERETKELSFLVEKPDKPFYALVGGAKLSSKIGVLYSLLEKVDALFIGGLMAYSFFKAQNIPIGNTFIDEESFQKAREILHKSFIRGIPIYLPVDVVVTRDLSPDAYHKTISIEEGIPAGFQGVDIGPRTVEKFYSLFKDAKTLFWNGPFGVFEAPPYDQGTLHLAEKIAQMDARIVIGGGDSVAAFQQFHISSPKIHLSTGGGAALELLEFGTLPGIEALKESKSAAIS